MGAARADGGLRREDGGGEIHGPEHHSGCVRADALGGEHAAHLSLVVSQITRRFGDEQARKSHAATGAGHVVEAGAGVKVMAAAGASANRRALAMVAVGKRVPAETDDQVLRTHRVLRRVI